MGKKQKFEKKKKTLKHIIVRKVNHG